jgi:enoyl reductase
MVATQTYRAAVARSFGPPDVLRIEDLPVAPLPAGTIRVAVRVGGVNPVDAAIRSGSFGGGIPFVPGTEFAGVVTEIAAGVAGVAIGAEVVGFGTPATNADLVVTSPDRVVVKPTDLSWELAGAVGAVGQTALTVLDALQLSADEPVIVHGGSGGVGTVMVQLLVAAGGPVVATASAARADYLRDLGATPLAYGPDLPALLDAEYPDGFAASIDLVGTPQAGAIGAAVREAGGQAITIAPESAQSHGIPFIQVQRSQERLARLLTDAASGTLRMPVQTLPLKEIVEAHRRLDSGHALGKTVLDLSDNPYLPEA